MSSSMIRLSALDPAETPKAHHPFPVPRRRAPPWPPRPPQKSSSHRRYRLLSSTRDIGPRSPSSRGDLLLPSPSRSPPPPRRGRLRQTPSTTTRRWTQEKRTWTGESSCGGSRGRWRAPASYTRSGGGGGTRTRGTSASGSPATQRGGSAAGASRVHIHLMRSRSKRRESLTMMGMTTGIFLEGSFLLTDEPKRGRHD